MRRVRESKAPMNYFSEKEGRVERKGWNGVEHYRLILANAKEFYSRSQ